MPDPGQPNPAPPAAGSLPPAPAGSLSPGSTDGAAAPAQAAAAPAAGARPAVDANAQIAEALKAAALVTQEARAAAETFRAAAAPRPVEQPRPALPTISDEDLADIDPKVRKLMEVREAQLISRLGEHYTQDQQRNVAARQDDLTYRANLERDRAAETLPGFKERSEFIDRYMANAPVELRAQQGMYKEAYLRQLGIEAYEKLIAEPAPGFAGSTTRDDSLGTTMRISGEERQALKGEGFVEGEIDLFAADNLGRRVVDINQIRAARAAGAKR